MDPPSSSDMSVGFPHPQLLSRPCHLELDRTGEVRAPGWGVVVVVVVVAAAGGGWLVGGGGWLVILLSS